MAQFHTCVKLTYTAIQNVENALTLILRIFPNFWKAVYVYCDVRRRSWLNSKFHNCPTLNQMVICCRCPCVFRSRSQLTTRSIYTVLQNFGNSLTSHSFLECFKTFGRQCIHVYYDVIRGSWQTEKWWSCIIDIAKYRQGSNLCSVSIIDWVNAANYQDVLFLIPLGRSSNSTTMSVPGT